MGPIEFDSFGDQSSSSFQPMPGKTVRGAFSDVTNFKNTDVTERGVEEIAMTKALEKWYLIGGMAPWL